MIIKVREWITIPSAVLLLSLLCAAQADDYIGIAARQTCKRFDASSDKKAGTEIPPAYWAEAFKSLQLEKVYLHDSNIVMVLHTRNGTEEGWYFPISTSFQEPYLGIRTGDGFTFTGNNAGHGYPFIRTSIESAAPADSNWLFYLERNLHLASERSEAINRGDGLEAIPSKYWPDSLKAMNPIRIYMDGLNYAIVLRIQDGMEEGRYFIPLRSSDMIFFEDGKVQSHGQFILTSDPDSKSIKFKRRIPD